MSNMSYCRFENTYRDLLDCYRAMDDEKSEREQDYMHRLVDVCRDIIEEYELNEMSQDDDIDDEIEDAVRQSYEHRFNQPKNQ